MSLKEHIPLPRKGRPPTLREVIRKAPENHIERFTRSNLSLATSYWHTAKSIGRKPVLRTIDGYIYVYLDTEK